MQYDLKVPLIECQQGAFSVASVANSFISLVDLFFLNIHHGN